MPFMPGIPVRIALDTSCVVNLLTHRETVDADLLRLIRLGTEGRTRLMVTPLVGEEIPSEDEIPSSPDSQADDRLFIRARTSMLGYLNAPSPFDEDGWLDTGDAVIQEGDYYRILGRESDIINVGGQKVYPAEVEKVLSDLPGVIETVVSGEEHLLLGQVVVATIQMDEEVPAAEMRRKVGEHCRGRLQPYMIPQKVRIVLESPVNYRFKKVRQ